MNSTEIRVGDMVKATRAHTKSIIGGSFLVTSVFLSHSLIDIDTSAIEGGCEDFTINVDRVDLIAEKKDIFTQGVKCLEIEIEMEGNISLIKVQSEREYHIAGDGFLAGSRGPYYMKVTAIIEGSDSVLLASGHMDEFPNFLNLELPKSTLDEQAIALLEAFDPMDPIELKGQEINICEVISKLKLRKTV